MLLLFTNHVLLLITITFISESPLRIAARSTPHFTLKQNEIRNVDSFQRRGHAIVISQIKKYFHRFGFLPARDYNVHDNAFDAPLKSAIVHYQSNLGLSVTGKLDFDTLTQIRAPRCGVPEVDTARTLHAKKDFVFFPGKPRWSRQIPMTLKYSVSKENMINYLNMSDIKVVFKRAFAKWASVIPVSFIETDDYEFAYIRIGFYSGDHGDGEPFDGVLGVLAYSFSPESGKFHLDAAETRAVDLESVAVHEIGHLLGLSHSPVKEAVMYPTLRHRDEKLNLALDDIQGMQCLQGSNPNFTIGSLSESDILKNQAVDLRIKWSLWNRLMLHLIICFCMYMILHEFTSVFSARLSKTLQIRLE